MAHDRRTFLKTTALAGIAAAGVPFTSTAPLANTQADTAAVAISVFMTGSPRMNV